MPHDESRKSGQWVYRNHRWCYVPTNVANLEVIAPRLTPGRLWSILDLPSLLDQIRSLQSLAQVPFVVALQTRDEVSNEHPERFVEPDRVEVFHAPWCEQAMDSDIPVIDHCQADMVHATSRGISERSPLSLASIWGEQTIRVVPLLLGEPLSVLSLGAIAVLLIDRGLFPTPEALHARVSATFPVPMEWARSVWQNLPAEGVPARAFKLLGDILRNFRKCSEREVANRLELASEQARSRQLLVRVETLEVQTLKGASEMEHVAEFGDLPRGELEAILAIPELGVIIEDTSYHIRYLNPYMRRHFGNAIGHLCYETVNKGSTPCAICPIKKLWGEGRSSFRYTTFSEKTGQVFEVVSVPFMSSKGEKLVLEVGLNVTEMHTERQRLERELSALVGRNTELQELTRALNMVVFDYFQEIQDVIETLTTSIKREREAHLELFLDQSLPLSDWAQQLTTIMETLGALVAESRRLSLSLGSVGLATSVDVRALLLTMSSGTSGLWRELPTPEVGDVPPVETNRAALAILLGVWMRVALDKNGNPGARPFISYTSSASLDSLVPGDLYHVLALRCVDTSAPGRATRQPAQQAASRFDATQLLLLARYLGGKVREETTPLGVTHYLSLPRIPPKDMRRL